MSIIFLSDLHLEESRPDITRIFLNFLHQYSKQSEKIFILGDFFEAWIGDDDHTHFNHMIINSLKQTVDNGTPIYFMHGNRDFLLGQKFFRQSGCVQLPDEFVTDVYGKRILLMHGDSLCTADEKYMRFRKKSRRYWVKKLFLWKSLRSRKKIAEQYRAASKNYVSTAPDHLMDVTPKAVETVMMKHQVLHLIHGHTHRQNQHHFKLNLQNASRTVLGAWHHKGNILVCQPNGTQQFIDLD